MYGSCDAEALISELPDLSSASMSGAPSTRSDEELAPVQLLGGKVDADRGRIVDGEDRIHLGEARQQALRHGDTAVARALRILIVRQDLDVRVLFEHRTCSP